MKKYLLITAITILFSVTAIAKNDMEIVAIVGDDAVSSLDVKNRMDLAISSSGIKPTAEVKERLSQQIIKTLIDEKISAQEAKRLNITVNQQDIDNAIMNLEERNKIKPGTFKEFVKGKGISYDNTVEQLRAQLTWSKIVNKQVRPGISVTDHEMEEMMENISTTSGISELDISEIVLPVDNPKDLNSVKNLANKLVQEIRKGANFTDVAKQFSKSTTAESGGSLGWMREEQTPKEILPKVKTLRIGEISEPFLDSDNYYIVRLNDRKAGVKTETTEGDITIRQAFIPVTEGTSEANVKELAANIMKKSTAVKSCDDFPAFAKSINSQTDPQPIKTKFSEINPDMINTITTTPVGKLTPIVMSTTGLNIFAVCKKPEPVTSIVVKDKIKEIIFRRKIELQAQRYLRDLRKKSYIEIRS
jgi:peptidyl-prolyl cis-trans isomerase SurA